MRTHLALLIAALAAAGAAAAAEPGTVYRLTPDQIAAITPSPTAHDPKIAFDPLFDRSLYDPQDFAPRRDRRPHGEVGAFVGSGGARGVFGTVEAPIGDNGFASFSFEDSQYDRRAYRRRY